jgi:hypothetical protein
LPGMSIVAVWFSSPGRRPDVRLVPGKLGYASWADVGVGRTLGVAGDLVVVKKVVEGSTFLDWDETLGGVGVGIEGNAGMGGITKFATSFPQAYE